MKSLFYNFLTILVSILFALSAAELFVRYSHNAYPFDIEMVRLAYLTDKDKNLRWRFPPKEGRNSLGLRNREITAKKENVFRILFLGDSLIWSGKTRSGEQYTQVIENNLNQALKSEKKIEVINAGIPGYTTYQEMEFLKAYGLDMEPDMVILGFVFNDLFYKYLHKPTEKELLSHEPQAELNQFDTNSTVGSVFAKSYLAHSIAYIIERIQNKLARRPYLSFEHRRDFYLAWKPYGWRHSERLIAQMKQLLDKKNIQFNVITFPVSSQVDKSVLSFDEKYVLYPQSRIKEIAAKNNIPFYDLTNSIQNNGDLKLYKDYLHFNSNGNDIIAKELTQYLLTKNYANPETSPRTSSEK